MAGGAGRVCAGGGRGARGHDWGLNQMNVERGLDATLTPEGFTLRSSHGAAEVSFQGGWRRDARMADAFTLRMGARTTDVTFNRADSSVLFISAVYGLLHVRPTQFRAVLAHVEGMALAPLSGGARSRRRRSRSRRRLRRS